MQVRLPRVPEEQVEGGTQEMDRTNIATDCVELDGAEPISVTMRRADGSQTIVVPSALRRSLSRDVSTHPGLSISGDGIVWNLPQTSLGDESNLRPGDTIVAGNETWSIASVRLEALGTRWRCVCRRQA